MPKLENPPGVFSLPQFDDLFSARTNRDEWSRIIAFRNHGAFLCGLKAYREKIPDYFSDNIVLNRVVTEAWRFEMLVYTLYLYDIRNPADPRTGLTVSNLQKICLEQKCASRGRVFAILGMMRVAGYLRASRSIADSRVLQLEPSEGFVAIVEGWNRRLFEIIDAVLPEGRLAHRHATEPRFGWNMRRRGAESLLQGWKLLDPFPEVVHFVSRDGGWMLLLTCVADSLEIGEALHIRPISIDLATFGKRFGVSRSHLRRLLESAHAEGLLEVPPRNGAHIMLSQRTVAAFLNCMASELGFYNQHANAS